MSLLNEKPRSTGGSNAVEKISIPEIDAAILMLLLEESHCDEYYNEEQVNSLMESLEAEIRMADHGSCSVEGDIESIHSFEWDEMETDMNWNLEDHVEDISMDELVRFGNDFAMYSYEVPFENGYASLWQETYDTSIYN